MAMGAIKMDTRASSGDRAAPRTDGESAWMGELYAACQTLRSASDGMITAVSVTLPRTDEPDNSVQVELVSVGIARMYDLDATTEVQDSFITVRFSLPTPGHEGA